MYGTSTVASQIVQTAQPISDILTNALPWVVSIVGALIGLGMLLHYANKWLGNWTYERDQKKMYRDYYEN